jgi:hypothetical protein
MNATTLATEAAPRSAGSRTVWLALALATTLVALLLGWRANVDSASAKSEIFGYSSFPSALNGSSTQAGAHPDIVTTFEMGSRLTQASVPCYCNDPKELTLHVPPGVIANPHVVSVCPIAQMALFECPGDSQAGVVVLELFGYGVFPLYRTIPQRDQAGLFTFSLPFGLSIPQYIAFSARTGSDYGLDVKTVGISHILPLLYYAPIYWGVPADPFYDFMRFEPEGTPLEIFCNTDPTQVMVEHDAAGVEETCPFGIKGVPSSLPPAPLTQNPTTCVGPLTSSMDNLSYDLEADHAEATWPATTGCDALSFDPSLAANPTTTETDTASGLEVTIKVPQFQDPETPSPSELRASTVTLPEGFSINPNAADGKLACTDEQSRVGTDLEAECPEYSKVGTVTIDSSALPAPIDGFVYIGEPKPGDRYRLVLTANGFGTFVKLLGSLHADPQTGQLTTSFNDLPQTPFQEFVLHLFGSERGILATPTQCGTYPVDSTFTPWDEAVSDQKQTQFFVLDHGPTGGPCPPAVRTFNPGFQAGSQDSTGGKYSPFGVQVSREDGEQNLSGVTVSTPPGVLASLKGIPYCPQSAIDTLNNAAYAGRAELVNSACPAASQVGTANVGAGAGTHPLHTTGKVYLAGPYGGAPLSLLVVVPAVSGPYDLGNVAVRVALHVDPASARVTAVSDPLPRILDGVVLRTRSIRVNLDRSDFTLNPTNCDPLSVDVTILGEQGGAAAQSALFQAANCRDLPFNPKLTLSLKGGPKRRGHPSLRALLKAKHGESNISSAVVALPPNEQLDVSHIKTVCTKVQFANDACPGGSIYGHATAESPLLDQPLEGPVYLRSSKHKLPDIVAALHGQIDVELSGRVDSVRGGLRTRFGSVPDAPISRFSLRLFGGGRGLFVNAKAICATREAASATMVGQNGRRVKRKVELSAGCRSKTRHKRHRGLNRKHLARARSGR